MSADVQTVETPAPVQIPKAGVLGTMEPNAELGITFLISSSS
jgi:hypothetical protein